MQARPEKVRKYGLRGIEAALMRRRRSLSHWLTKLGHCTGKHLEPYCGIAICSDWKSFGCSSDDHPGDHLTSVNWNNSL
jgi:hypothetical protein